MRKHLILTLLLSFMTFLVSVAQEKSYQLSSHILDIQNGRPAPGVRITLSRLVPQQGWVEVEERTTDDNGRVRDFLEQRDKKGAPGTYKLTYYVGPYFEALAQDSFYPFIEVVFEIKDGNHYHVPITLSPYGYSTYRGN